MPEDPPIPVGDEQDYLTHGYCLEALKEADLFMRAQPGYDKIQESIDAVMGLKNESPLSRLSHVRSNRIGKIVSDMAALLTDTKPFWEFKSDNPKYQKQQKYLGKRSSSWFWRNNIDMRFGDMMRYFAVGGTSHAHLQYNSDVRDMDVESEDPRDVLPFRPKDYLTNQGAQGIIIRRQRPVNYVKQKWPEKADQIVADRDGSYSTSQSGPTARLYESLNATPFNQRLWGEKPERELPKMPVTDVFTMYLRDDRRNEKSYDVRIGQFDKEGRPENNWSYKVPPGEPLYPRKRCVIFTRTCVLYNSTSIYWHGMYPVVKLTLEPFPTTWLGKGLVWDLIPLQNMYNRVLRAMDDLLAKFAQPDIIADKNSMSRAALSAMNTRAPGQKFIQGPVGKGLTIQYPQAIGFELGAKMIEILRDELDTISGERDFSQLLKLGQLPSANAMEKLQEQMTPATRGRSRILEAFIREFAEMLAYNFAQFDTMEMRLAEFGPDALTPEDFDFMPGSFIPDYVHPGDFGYHGIPTPKAMARGPLPGYDRAREFMRQFTFNVAPGSLLAASEIERKMMYLQLARGGLIDSQTLLEVMGIPNIPEIMERRAQEQATNMGMQVSAAGRKASGQAPPRMAIKES